MHQVAQASVQDPKEECEEVLTRDGLQKDPQGALRPIRMRLEARTRGVFRQEGDCRPRGTHPSLKISRSFINAYYAS